MKIIECVPNFSEGNNEELFNEFQNEIKNLSNVKLLSLEPDADYNRVVVTLAGDEIGIVDGALKLCQIATKYIDMRKHKGEHPRLGAIDVVPFIPIKNVTMDECVEISKIFGKKLYDKLNIPVYFYEYSATNDERKNLANIRKGEYEGLREKILDPNWKPDVGEPVFNEMFGATVTGARFFLIAYNVNLATEDITPAKEIAETLRESGKIKRDEEGKPIKVNGETVKIPGRLKAVKGMGVKLEKYKMTQISMNLTNFNITPLHVAFEEAKKEAELFGVKVTGSEIVGLVPLEAILKVGEFYAEGKFNDEESLVKLAIDKLGLSDLHPFNPKEKIIDYMI